MDQNTSILQGKNNIVADALSRLEKEDDKLLSETEEGLILSHAMCAVEKDEEIGMPETRKELVRNIMNFDEMESEEFTMIPAIIAREQQKDSQLKDLIKSSEKFSERTILDLSYEKKIYIPQSLRKRIVWWYPTYLQHPGITRMEATLRQNLTWTNIRKDVAAVKNIMNHECQIGKKVRNKYGELPEKLSERPIAWIRVDVDLIGPLTIQYPSGKR
jgi:hypothetical protein